MHATSGSKWEWEITPWPLELRGTPPYPTNRPGNHFRAFPYSRHPGTSGSQRRPRGADLMLQPLLEATPGDPHMGGKKKERARRSAFSRMHQWLRCSQRKRTCEPQVPILMWLSDNDDSPCVRRLQPGGCQCASPTYFLICRPCCLCVSLVSQFLAVRHENAHRPIF